MSTMCGCGHDMERHNDDGSGMMTGSYAGNCRMCECEGFVKQESHPRDGKMIRCSKHDDYLHLADWGCPFCYKETSDKKRKEVEPPSEGDVNDYDLRHLNTKIDSLQRSIGEMLLLADTRLKNGQHEGMHPLNRLDCILKEAKGALGL